MCVCVICVRAPLYSIYSKSVCACVCVAPPTCMNRADGFSTSMCFIDAAARCYGGLRSVAFIQPFNWARGRRRIVPPPTSSHLIPSQLIVIQLHNWQSKLPSMQHVCHLKLCPPPPHTLLRFLKTKKTPSEKRSAAGSSRDTLYLWFLRLCFSRSHIHVRPSICFLFFSPFLPFHKLSSIKVQTEDDYRLLTRAAD